ncbi:discoidin domain-containing protein, partial [bacterium]|nr:discoidin domain-containing protein [bacterium]
MVIGAWATMCCFNPCAVSAGIETIVPVGVTASSSYPAWGEPVSLINGSGLTGTGREATHTNAGEQYLLWHSDGNGVNGQWVEFDLGAAYDVENALVWQLAQANLTARGVQTFTISVAGTNQVFSTYATDKRLNIATGALQEPVQVVPLTARDVRYVRFTVQSNFGDQYVGLSEVRFEGVLSGPQPLNIIQPVGASASTTYAPESGFVSPQYLIDGSGLSGIGLLATHTSASAYYLLWHSDGSYVTGQWVESDLGAAYDVKNALIW